MRVPLIKACCQSKSKLMGTNFTVWKLSHCAHRPNLSLHAHQVLALKTSKLATDSYNEFQISYIFNFCIYLNAGLIISKWSCSGQIHISIIKKSHKILEKTFQLLLCTGALWLVDRAVICDPGRSLAIIENYTVEKLVVRIGTDTLKMVCTRQ